MLLVTADADERVLAAAVLRGVLDSPELVEVRDAIEFADAAGSVPPTLAVVARALPWADGLDVLRLVHRRYPQCITVLIGETAPDIDDPERQPSAHLSRGVAGLARLGVVVERALRSRQSPPPRVGAEALDDAPIPLLSVDAAEHVIAANRQAAEMMGYADPSELVGRPLADMIGLDDDLCGSGPAQTAAASKAGLDGVARSASGVLARCRVVARAESRRGVFGGYLVALVPRELEPPSGESALVSALSHDLRQPLFTARQSAEMLVEHLKARARLGADEERMLGRILTGTARLSTLIDGLLAYVRGGSRPLAIERVDLGAVVGEVVEHLRATIEQAGAVVAWDALPVVDADRGEMMRLLENLIENAVQYRGTAPPRVEVEAADHGDRWVLRVRDNGLGIAPDAADRIFDPFQRLHTQQERPGSGLGLAICRQICRRHGGGIRVTSNPEGGSTFHVTIAKNVHRSPDRGKELLPATGRGGERREASEASCSPGRG